MTTHLSGLPASTEWWWEKDHAADADTDNDADVDVDGDADAGDADDEDDAAKASDSGRLPAKCLDYQLPLKEDFAESAACLWWFFSKP